MSIPLIVVGVLYILLAGSVLFCNDNVFSVTHFLYKQELAEDTCRWIGYYLFMQGMMRLCLGIAMPDSRIFAITTLTFLLEALFILHEWVTIGPMMNEQNVFAIAVVALAASLPFYYKLLSDKFPRMG